MDSTAPRSKRGADVLSLLNVAIETMNLGEERVNMTPAKAAFGSVSVILTMIRGSMINEKDYVDLGLACAEVCKALYRGMKGRRMDEFGQPVFEAIEQLTTTVEEIRVKVAERGKRNITSRLFKFRAKDDKETIGAWWLDLSRILRVLNTELALNIPAAVSEFRHEVANTRTIVSDIHRTIVIGQGGADGRGLSVSVSRALLIEEQTPTISRTQPRPVTSTSTPGESPPLPPRIFLGRDELAGKLVRRAKKLIPFALIGAGGIGKSSIALAVLHDDRIKKRFGDDRRFIRCDQFPATIAHFLGRLSKVIGTGVENPEDLTPLRPFLSSREFFIVLDNAESILDPRGANAQEIYAAVDELSQFSNICLCITSSIPIIPPACESLDVPTLSLEAARGTFYQIHKNCRYSDAVNNILEQLNFHPLSVTLLATVALHNKWDVGRLCSEWETQRTSLLPTQQNTSLAATIELSLASPMFRELGPDARGLLGVVAFFPQGIDEKNINRLFPTTSDGENVFDAFCVLSLTHRSDGFITMLAPLRDHLRPGDPGSSPLLNAAKEYYFRRLAVRVDPRTRGFGEARWITSEDVNVEHLLNIFTSVDANSDSVWGACADFMAHLRWHKPRLVVLGPKVEALPDRHPSKARSLLHLSRLFDSVGNVKERKRLLIEVLRLRRGQGDEVHVAETLMFLGDANRRLGYCTEGIQQVEEALEIYKRLGSTAGQVRSLQCLAMLLRNNSQFSAAEKTVSRALNLLSRKGEEFEICQSYRLLSDICLSKGETKKAKKHLKAALKVASSFGSHAQQFFVLHSLADLFFDEDRLNDAQTHVERAKIHAADNTYWLAQTMWLQARIWYKQHRLGEAKAEALRVVDAYEKLGAVQELETCKELLRAIREATKPSYY